MEEVHFFPLLLVLQRKEIKTKKTGAKMERKSRKSILPRGNNFDNKVSNRAHFILVGHILGDIVLL